MKHYLKILIALCTLLLFAVTQEWQRLYPFPEVIINTLRSVDFVDENWGWAVGDWGIIMHTKDGGQNWEIQQNHMLDWDLLSVNFINRQTGWVVGEYGTILHTKDGGDHWLEIDSGIDMENFVYFFADVQFINKENGWILPDYDSFIVRQVMAVKVGQRFILVPHG